MITFYDAQGAMAVEFQAAPCAGLPSGTVWIDLHDETPEETAFVERVTGVKMPSAHRLAEVEASSRQSIDGESLVMSSPVLYRDNGSVSSHPGGLRSRSGTPGHAAGHGSEGVFGLSGAHPDP